MPKATKFTKIEVDELVIASKKSSTDVIEILSSDKSRVFRITETSGGFGWLEVDNNIGNPITLFRTDGGTSYHASGDFVIGSSSGGTDQGKLNVISNNANHALKIDQNVNTSNSTSVGGAILLDNSNNDGAGLIIYSTKGDTATGRLLNIRNDNPDFSQTAFHIDYAGTVNACEVVNNSNSNTSQAWNITSNNNNDSAVGISGKESAKGTVKIVHNKPSGADAGASVLSLRANGAGTQAHGIFFDSEQSGGTTGDLMLMRQNGVNTWRVDKDGILQNGIIPTSTWQAKDYGYLIWMFDQAVVNNQTVITPGTLYVNRLIIPQNITVSNIHVRIGTAGATLANSYVALYNNNTLLTQSSDQSSNWTSTGEKTIGITPQVISAGTRLNVVFWVGSAGTAPGFARSGTQGGANGNLTGDNLRWSTADTGITTIAPSTLGARTTSNNTFWVAIS